MSDDEIQRCVIQTWTSPEDVQFSHKRTYGVELPALEERDLMDEVGWCRHTVW